MESKSGKFQTVMSIVMLGIAGLSWLGWYSQRAKMGTEFALSANEAVNYSGTATEDDARKLGAVLQELGYLGSPAEKDFLLYKGETETTLSIVVQDDAWNDPAVLREFEALGESAAGALGGLPLTVKLIDEHLKDKHDIPITSTRSKHKHSDLETIVLRGAATVEQAQALGAAMKDAGFFDGSGTKVVMLDLAGDAVTLSMVVQDGKWEDAAIVDAFQAFGVQIAPALGGKPYKLQLVDATLQPQKVLEITP